MPIDQVRHKSRQHLERRMVNFEEDSWNVASGTPADLADLPLASCSVKQVSYVDARYEPDDPNDRLLLFASPKTASTSLVKAFELTFVAAAPSADQVDHDKKQC